MIKADATPKVLLVIVMRAASGWLHSHFAIIDWQR